MIMASISRCKTGSLQRNQMGIDFVSLFEVIRAVSPCIKVSEDELGYYSESPIDDTHLARMMARTPARQCFQASRAAAHLLEHFTNSSIALRWFDKSLTGIPLLFEDARKESRDELVNLTNQERYFKAHFERARRGSSRWEDAVPDAAGEDTTSFRDIPKRHRFWSIGFDRAEIVSFLDRSAIPHRFSTNSGNEVKNGIPTPVIAAAFAGLSGWDMDRWKKNLSAAAWAKDAQTRSGRKGTGGSALWDPVLLAKFARTHRGISLHELGKVFRATKAFEPWLAEWKVYEEDARWSAGKNPAR